jgi:hypothetical protein
MDTTARIVSVGVIGAITRCEPAFDVDGAFFPAWLLCMAAGGLLSIVLYRLFVWTRIDPYLGHPLVIYPALYVLTTLLTWIVFYRT